MRLFRRKTPRLGGAQLYQVDDFLLICRLNRTTSGFWVSTDDVVRLNADVTGDALGECLVDSTARTEIGVANPPVRGGTSHLTAAMVKASGRRSYRAFVRDSILVGVNREDDTFAMDPTRNNGPLGPDRGYEYLPGTSMSCSAGEVGPTALAALAQAIPFSG
jgi:hypothetical protein